MNDGLVFPDVRECLLDLIGGTVHLGQPVRAVWWLEADEYGAPLGPFPVVQITRAPGGTEGYIDRMDPVILECFAPGTLAMEVLESVKASICGDSIETPHGYLDSIAVTSIPEEGFYPSDVLNKAVATFNVVSRPIN